MKSKKKNSINFPCRSDLYSPSEAWFIYLLKWMRLHFFFIDTEIDVRYLT